MSADPAAIRAALAVLVEPGAVVELRVPNARRGTVSGYFDDTAKLAEAAAEWSGQAPGVYVTLNPVAPRLLARAHNRVIAYAKHTTGDADVRCRRWLPIDFDPVRPAGISSTDDDHAAALTRARTARDWLVGEGWPSAALILADSGNGAHLLARIDLRNDAESAALVKRCLEALALRFGDDAVGVDLTTFNAGRIWKLYGTLAAKGDATPDRPHRLARLLTVPARVEVLPRPALERLAAVAPEPARGDGRRNGSGVDVDRWLADHGLAVTRVTPWNGGTLHELARCPWNADHVATARVIRFASGALSAGCFHNGCAGKGWHDLRDLVEPGWRDRPRADPRDDRTVPDPRRSPWAAAQPAPDFPTHEDADQDFLEPRLLAPGSITQAFSPRGLGKTHVAHALMVKHARAGKHVLLIDRDNSRREVRRRLKAWGAADCPTLRVMTRDQAPPMTDRAAWAAFPFAEYDVVMIDSIDAATEGVGESDSARPAAALATILDIAHREAGPAILVLGNVVKSGAHSRGSGVVEDRADICYEVRDATNLQPTGSTAWWLELPAAGREAWAERAVRRKRRERYRLAFIPSKFRLGEEPDPFIFEIDLSAESWSLRDVTLEVVEAGEQAQNLARDLADRRIENAIRTLAERIADADRAGSPWTVGQAEEALRQERDFTRKDARRLIAEGAGRHWRVESRPGEHGRAKVLLPIGPEVPSGNTAAIKERRETPPPALTPEPLFLADRMNSGRRETGLTEPASTAAIREGAFLPPSSPNTPDDEHGEKLPAWVTEGADPDAPPVEEEWS